MAYYVTQQNGTERPFTGILNKEYRRGDYFCIVCDTLLFTDQMKLIRVVAGQLSIQNTTMQGFTASLTHLTG